MYYGDMTSKGADSGARSAKSAVAQISFWARAKKYGRSHKVVSGVAFAIVLAVAWWAYAKATAAPAQTHYILGTVSTGTIVQSLSESGQVSAVNTVDVQAQVSGQLTGVYVHAGQHVRAGQTLMTIDNTTAQQALANAKAQLATDELTYQQNATQAPINYQKDQTALDNASSTLSNDYNSTYTDIVNTYLNLPTAVAQAQDTIEGYDFDTKRLQWNKDVLANLFTPQQDTTDVSAFEAKSVSEYSEADAEYEKALSLYQQTPRTASAADLDTLLSQSIAMTTSVAQDLQDELNFLNAVSNLAQTYNISLPSKFSTVQSSTNSSLSTVNGDLSTLLSDRKTLQNDKQAITSAGQTLQVDRVGNDSSGSNPISLQVEANTIAEEKQTIANDETNLSYYSVAAPFSGTVSAVNVNQGDSANGTLATIISDSQIAQLSVNEVDAAKLKLGDKATLTFDAIPDLTLTGTVAEIDSVGTVSQGVVSYTVKISFDTVDPRVKSGMTVNAAIQTGVAQHALLVPSSAVKTSGSTTYVLVFDPAIASSTAASAGSRGIVSSVPPQQVPVVTGLTDNTNTEIVSGLSEGQQIVTRTTTGTAAVTAATAGSARGGFGGGGGIRIGG
jgi:RND family efflux transporter MFP subunit